MNANPVHAAQIEAGRRSSPYRGNTDERWSMGMALAATVLVPAYFFGTPYYSPEYVPIRPWVWAMPGVICILYLFAQFWALLHSAGRSDDIGMKDTVVSLVSALSSFGTLIAMSIFWVQGSFHFGVFQVMAITIVTLTTFGELIFTAWVRYLVNRRYFSTVQQTG
jgi:hypothetical protein